LALFNAHARLDLDAALVAAYDAGAVPSDTDPAIVAQLELAALFRTAAREKVEAHTGRYFAPQTLELTYRLDEAYVLPAGATATGVTGFYADLDALANASTFLSEYRKGISINRELAWCDAVAQTYTVTATTVGDPQFLGLAKRAMLEIAAEWYKNREASGGSIGTNQELPVSWRVTLAQAVVNPLGY
jgi:hypothetical protein